MPTRPLFPFTKGFAVFALCAAGFLPLAPARAAAVAVAETEAGRPLIQTFGLRDYHAHSQNWGPAQDARGVLYFGNKDIVLEYDGVAWRKLPIPGATFVRGLAFDPASDAVFVGAVDELGYLRLDPDGGRTFVSLRGELPADARGFREIRRVHTLAPDDIVFAAETQIMRWHAGKFTVWRPGNKETMRSFAVDNDLYVHSRDLGLLRLSGGVLVPVSPAMPAMPGADFLRPGGTDNVTALLPGALPGELLAGTAEHGFLTIAADGRATLFPTGADPFLKEHKIRRARRLPDSTLAVATLDAGLVWLGADGRFLSVVDQASGLPRDLILDLSTDREGGLWLGLSSGMARVELSGAISVFDDHNGLPRTTTNDLARVDGTLFLATDNGLFRLDPAAPGPPARPAHWEKVAGEELWTLCAAGAGGVLAGTIESIYHWHPDNTVTSVLDPGVGQPRILQASRRDPARIWAGMREGLRSLRRDGGGAWRDEGPVAGLEDEEIRSAAETGDGTLWVGTPTRGVFHVTFAPGTADAGAPRGQPVKVQRYFKTNGLPENMGWTGVTPWRGGPGELHFSTQAGEYRYDPAADRFAPAPEFGGRWADGSAMIAHFTEDAAGDMWVAARSTQGVWLDQEIGRARLGGAWEPLPKRIGDQLGETQGILPEVGPDGAGVVWIYGTDSMVRVLVPAHGAGTAKASHGGGNGASGFGTHLRRVFTTNGPPGSLNLGGGGTLPASKNSVRFEYAADTFRYGADLRYQTRLEGPAVRGAAWSELTARTGVDYSNLPPGEYRFRVRGQDRDGRVGGEAQFAFGVRPHWSRTTGALAAYILLGALAVAGLVHARSRRLRRANAALEARITRQTGDLIRARDAAESANRAKSAFLANMSHELRTPLNAVLGYTQIILKEDSLPPKNRERLGVVARSGEHLLAMINEVLDLSKIEAGKVKLDLSDFPLAHLLDAAADTFRPRAAERRIAFALRCAPGLPAAVQGDEGKLRQVLFNLLGNAVKFTQRGGVELKVEPADAAGRVRFEVSDTGIGIAAEELQNIFLAFHQAPGSGASLAAQGTGLGLAISQRLTGMMGGELRVESTPGAGSRFWFELPLRAVNMPPQEFAPSANGVHGANGANGVHGAAHVPPPGTMAVGYHGPRRRLLVVDDDTTNRRILEELLTPLGFDLEDVASGEECIARCAREPLPDAVLLDLRMGGIDGFTTARALREQSENPNLKIIAVSASVFESDRRQALDAGCDDFLPKPFAETALLSALARTLSLEWVTAPAPGGSPVLPNLSIPAIVSSDSLTPPAADLDALLELSRRGDVLRIRRKLASLRAADPRHAAFLEPLESYAASYQMNRLRDALLELQSKET